MGMETISYYHYHNTSNHASAVQSDDRMRRNLRNGDNGRDEMEKGGSKEWKFSINHRYTKWLATSNEPNPMIRPSSYTQSHPRNHCHHPKLLTCGTNRAMIWMFVNNNGCKLANEEGCGMTGNEAMDDWYWYNTRVDVDNGRWMITITTITAANHRRDSSKWEKARKWEVCASNCRARFLLGARGG